MLLLWAGENDPLSGLRGSGFLVRAFPYGDGEAVWQPPPTTPLQACQLEFQSIFSKNVENRKTDVVSMDCIYSWLINVAECEKSMMLAQPNDAKVCIKRVEDPEVQPLLFWLFLSIYLLTIFGNLLIILVFITDSHLHTPMYFFISNLSLCDIGLSSTTVPKMLVNIQAQSRAITYTGCITQMYFFTIFAGLDDFLLAVMAYDRFVAICHPLHYTVIMNPQICVLMVLGSWLLVVSLFYCTGVGMYISSAASHNTHSGSSASVMYTVITPMLNPFIYSLRNKDIRGALNKCFGGKSEK
nr:olfactory receptor 7A17-like [Dasypus novemcinctus]